MKYVLQILRKRRPKKLKKNESLRKKNHLEKSKSCRTRTKIIDTDAKHTPHYGSDDDENDEEAKEDDPVVNVHKKAS